MGGAALRHSPNLAACAGPAWRALNAVLYAGLDFHSCGCNGPGFRPRTPREVRERLQVAARREISVREAIALPDPYET
ncbi:hypothetical protein Pta02_72590 [Planobispora takensis]|uniref:Uncharacterized protein n=1 Tax=Planobispora takensis TaxID=1367882 RepID=A0A8J3T6E6_9ACTN|nr:hypothetical protein Pta02_72590 [Planobispora takensis]